MSWFHVKIAKVFTKSCDSNIRYVFSTLFFSLGPFFDNFQEKVEERAERYIINTIPIVGPSTRHQLLQRLGRPPLLQPQISASRFFCNQTRAHSPRREAIGSHRENLRVQAYRYSENLFHVYSDSNLTCPKFKRFWKCKIKGLFR